jgi:hypothetical protein
MLNINTTFHSWFIIEIHQFYLHIVAIVTTSSTKMRQMIKYPYIEGEQIRRDTKITKFRQTKNFDLQNFGKCRLNAS